MNVGKLSVQGAKVALSGHIAGQTNVKINATEGTQDGAVRTTQDWSPR